jgi:predicted DNA-binding transcriptional regulator YafY
MNFLELTLSEAQLLLSKNEISFTYKNWKGETSERKVKPENIEYTTSLYHPGAGYALFLHAFDVEKQQYRDFLCKDIEINLD